LQNNGDDSDSDDANDDEVQNPNITRMKKLETMKSFSIKSDLNAANSESDLQEKLRTMERKSVDSNMVETATSEESDRTLAKQSKANDDIVSVLKNAASGANTSNESNVSKMSDVTLDNKAKPSAIVNRIDSVFEAHMEISASQEINEPYQKNAIPLIPKIKMVGSGNSTDNISVFNSKISLYQENTQQPQQSTPVTHKKLNSPTVQTMKRQNAAVPSPLRPVPAIYSSGSSSLHKNLNEFYGDEQSKSTPTNSEK
jgi:hypothetical protein